MSTGHTKWQQYIDAELAVVRPLLESAGFELDQDQVHLQGERFLMSSNKMVLLGKRTQDGKRVVIKVTGDEERKQELRKEQATRSLLHTLPFAYQTFYSPKELYSEENGGILIVATEYIAEPKSFLKYSSTEQFFLVLRALQAQEGAHATTRSHLQLIKKTFGRKPARDYIADVKQYKIRVAKAYTESARPAEIVGQITQYLQDKFSLVEQYGEFLTHDDFAPHNVRIAQDRMYLLDHTSLVFGNKYESWGRLTNYMILYNRELEHYLVQYVKDNRGKDESEMFNMMRLYKAGTLLDYYASCVKEAQGKVLDLALARIEFWTDVSTSLLKQQAVSDERIATYKKLRDSLRSEEEKKRQRELGQL